ncbi:MAG: sensor domain-containing diguanylate cyclase [Candidatus Brocadiia bacterium]
MKEEPRQHPETDFPAEELFKNGTFFRLAVEEAWHALIVVDTDGRVVYANTEAERLFGRPRAELVGAELGHPMLGHEEPEIQILSPGGDIRVAHMRVGTLAANGETLHPVQLRDITELRQMREELGSLSGEDELTGLPNRCCFTPLAEHSLRLARKLRHPLVLLCVDVDSLAAINEQFGEGSGDELLKQTAELLKDTFDPADLVARIGGDEFVVLAAETSAEEAGTLLARLESAVAELNRTNRRPYRLSLTVGTARFDPDAPVELDELLGVADQAVHEARQSRLKD